MFRERRSGFQRRWTPHRAPFGAALEASLVYLRDHRGALVAMLALANLLSLIDLWFTSIALHLGVAEANPFMRYLFEANVTQAAIVKCGLVVAVSLGIWALRRYRVALMTALFFLGVYGAVAMYEIVGLAWMV
ncbi:MAG: DUF5658 family protein [Actinobacteria bacterium]|nr:DUF5658 family protein [Actinomycetota bacterium]